MLNVIFVKYTAQHVNKLAEQLKQYYPNANYYCYTENPQDVKINVIPVFKKPTLRFWWNKLALFSKDFPAQGECLYFDLDMDVKSNPSSYVNWDGLSVIDAYWKKDKYMAKHAYDVRINSSIITWTAGEQSRIWDHFLTNKDYFMRKYQGIDRFLVHESFQLNLHKHGIVSSVANEKIKNAPIDMYNGLNYELS
jgi:hypothetical protein